MKHKAWAALLIEGREVFPRKKCKLEFVNTTGDLPDVKIKLDRQLEWPPSPVSGTGIVRFYTSRIGDDWVLQINEGEAIVEMDTVDL